MQYISDKLVSVTHEVSNYSDMFATLKNSINKIEVVHEPKSFATSICIDAMGSDCIDLDEFKNLKMEDCSKALDLLIELREYLEETGDDSKNTNLKEVPENLFHFFNLERNIQFYNGMKHAKPMSKLLKAKKKNSKLKTKMFF